eukprot:54339-Pelagomonas_calceolata.AAC.1
MSRMSNMSSSIAHIPGGLSPQQIYSLVLTGRSHDVSAFLNQNNKLPFFRVLHELIAFYEQASSRTS